MQNGSIFIISEDNTLLRMEETSYDSEELLQKLLDNYPDLLAGDQINQEIPRRWIPIAREFGIPSVMDGNPQWRIDHLFIDQDCIPTFIEVKRSTDTRIRREVVGQMMDYAANATKYWPIETIQKAFHEKYLNDGKDAFEVLNDLLGSEYEDDENVEDFWTKVQANLHEGIIRMLFVADIIPDELRRIIEFMNDQMTKSEVLGIEIKQYLNSEKNIKTLVPRVIGLTNSTAQKKIITKKQWNKESFMTEVENRLGNEAKQVYQEIFTLLSAGPYRIWYGQGKVMGSIFFVYDGVESHNLIGMWTNGSFELQFQHLKNNPPFSEWDKRVDFQLKLKELLNVEIPEKSLNLRPSFLWEKLKTAEAREKLCEILSWVVDEIKNYESKN
ncbi:hypothetical protein HHO41_21225 [Bacillus sp. DNRA2]|uniref:hypothetical protein n=1 Tax=Bacillus sp. DNRA2 TaxID=2723053 RepID=UPI00145EAA99|nr:hypothetical protein [Bacillus sp. DNRA2]NMD72752.1 hypothetical protein [Bacillus sp. DNRA2]